MSDAKKPEDLDKGIKEAALALTMGMGSLAPTALNQPLNSDISPSAPQAVQRAAPAALHPDLEHIAFIESSNGKNKNHEMTNVGLSAGQTAGGSTGLMPLTVKEVVAKSPELSKKYSHLIDAPHGQVTAFINNHPEAEAEIANTHWKNLSNKFHNDRPRMAYAWRNGVTAAKRADVSTIFSHPYVQKFIHQTASRKIASLNKTLTIGHDIPGPNSTGGAALAEAFGKVKKKLKSRKITEIYKAIDELEEVESLLKGRDGDADKEGYTFKYTKHEDHPIYGGEAHEVTCHHEHHGQVGHSLFRPNDDGTLEQIMTMVDKDHRRKGIASGMVKKVCGITGCDVERSERQTSLGDKFMTSLDKIEELKERLEKMSRPKIGFPNFQKLNSRPDQQVQTIETGRQKDLYGRKVANASLKDAHNVPHTEMHQTSDGRFEIKSQSSKTVSQQKSRDKYSKQIAGTFDRNTLGLNASTKEGPKSAALAGKLRSKFEEGDDEYNAKLKAHTEKRNNIIKEHNSNVGAWREKAYQLGSKVDEPGGREAYDAHVGSRPDKPKLPRKPSKPRKETSDLSLDQQKSRGRSVDATIHHEAFHHSMAEMENHYGKQVARNVHSGMLKQFHPEALQSVGGFISSKLGYKPKSPKFTEEILAHSRDILTNPAKRAKYKAYAGAKADEHIKQIKIGHQKAYEYAKNLKPEDVGAKKSEQPEVK
jgi:hypothetical protein